jgi:DNA-binding NtrC family response regulator
VSERATPDAGRVRVLVVEDDKALSEVLCDALVEAGHLAIPARTLAAARAELARKEQDVILLDLVLPDGSGIQILRQLREENLLTETIVLTGFAAVETAIEAMKLGAYDYLTKPPRTDEIEILVNRATEKARLRRENAAFRVRLERQEPLGGLVTEDKGLRSLFALLVRAAASDLPVLLQGESGTGKELFARAVHKNSPRSGFPFVAVNCAAVPENLIESELFGHEKGAFTGAGDRKLGLFEVAGRGVLFLDEIGEIAVATQPKLLRALENGEFFRVGGTRTVSSQVRVVAASNRDLLGEVEAGRFRQDLYYRLNGITLTLPPLRDRKGDVPLLARHFLERAAPAKLLSNEAVDALNAYSWPGNVRELRMVMERAALLAASEVISPADLRLTSARPPSAGAQWPTDLTLAQMETEYIRSVLQQHNGHRGRAARALGIDPKTLYNKLGPGGR